MTRNKTKRHILYNGLVKILIIAANRENMPERVAPLGAYIVNQILDETRHDVSFIDLGFSSCSETLIYGAVRAAQPDLIGVSIRNMDVTIFPQSVSTLPLIKVVIERIRENSDAPIIIGGSGVSVMPEKVFDYLGADFALIGEAEASLVEFCELWPNGNWTEVPGLVFRDKQRTVINPPSCVEELNLVLNKRPFGDKYPAANIQSKRGCVFRCGYCTYPLLEGSTIRTRPPEDVVDEIESLVALGHKTITFVDNVFNYPEWHALEICEEMISRNCTPSWTADVQPRFINERLASLMNRAGCRSVNVGLDTLSEKMLATIGKDFSLDDVEKCNKALKKYAIQANYFLTFGYPEEDKYTIKETFDVVDKIGLRSGTVITGIRVYPKTRLASLVQFNGEEIGLQPVYCCFGENCEPMLDYIGGFAEKYSDWVFPGLRHNRRTNDDNNMAEYLSYDDWARADRLCFNEVKII